MLRCPLATDYWSLGFTSSRVRQFGCLVRWPRHHWKGTRWWSFAYRTICPTQIRYHGPMQLKNIHQSHLGKVIPWDLISSVKRLLRLQAANTWSSPSALLPLWRQSWHVIQHSRWHFCKRRISLVLTKQGHIVVVPVEGMKKSSLIGCFTRIYPVTVNIHWFRQICWEKNLRKL